MEAIPKEFYCPISQEIMTDPVIGPDSHTYERSAIVDWLNMHHTSPFTRQPMEASQLVTNLALKNAIEEMMKGPSVEKMIHNTPIVSAAAECNLELKLNTVKVNENVSLLNISVVPPTEGSRRPCAIICLVDTSGSMAGTGNLEAFGEKTPLSILDLVKHSVKTVAHMLDDNDLMAIISFSDSAKLVMDLQKMNTFGRRNAMENVEKMYPISGTNIWDALRIALELIKKNPSLAKINTSIWLFTDGEPNINPPRGIAATMKSFLEDKEPIFSINTFGFGYSLDSRMLMDLSSIGTGIFCYLPDCNLVGTTFVNCISNSLATGVLKASIQLKTEGIDKIDCVGNTMNKNCIEVGPIQYGQSRDFAFEFHVPAGKGFRITATLRYNGKEVVKSIDKYKADKANDIYSAFCRCKSNEFLIASLDMHRQAKPDYSFVTQVPEMIQSLPSYKDNLMQALLRDYQSPNENEGRVSKAYTTNDRLIRWGRHYVRSIIRAHQLQQCHNFKDPGVQLYGGKLFKNLQQKADMIFCNLPPPVPTCKVPPAEDVKMVVGITKKVSITQTITAYSQPPAPVDMTGYVDSGGCAGCFCGDGLVKLSNGAYKLVKELRKGDIVISSDNSTGIILCVVVFPINKKIDLSEINGLRLTNKHPIKIEGVWKYPMQISESKKVYCDFLYNLVLDNSHIVNINGIDMVTLGHEKYENEIVQHTYYGTDRVIRDLRIRKGWEEGVIIMDKFKKFRDPFTGKVMCIH